MVMVMSDKIFSMAPNIGVPTSRIPMALKHVGSMMFGKLVPLDALPVIPGDHIRTDIRGIIRMSTPIAPIMDDVECSVYSMYVPSRLLFDKFEEWYTTGNSSGVNGGPISLGNFTDLPSYSVYEGIQVGSIADYLGKPITSTDSTKINLGFGKVNALKERAYFKCWMDWFIPQQLVTASLNNSGGAGSRCGTYVAGGATTNVYVNQTAGLLPICKNFDYFTAATLSPQYATAAVQIPLGTEAPVMIKNNGSSIIQFNDQEVFSNFGINAGDKAQAYVNNAGTGAGVTSTNTLVADLSQAAAATVNALREAFAVQKYCERANFGNRFFEVLKAHYGVTSPDARLQRAENIGHASFLINTDEVVSTAGYQAGTSTEVGQPGAISRTGFRYYLGHKSFVEPGYLMTLISTRQKYHTYKQGIMREDSKLTKFEFYSPEFANLGDQVIKNKEIFLQGTATDEDVFGYQEHWAEDRYRPARSSGLLNVNASGALDYWTLGDKFSALPSLSAAFIFENRDNLKRVLTTGNSGPDFIFDIIIDYTADREMPVHVIPGLIDHFGTH